MSQIANFSSCQRKRKKKRPPARCLDPTPHQSLTKECGPRKLKEDRRNEKEIGLLVIRRQSRRRKKRSLDIQLKEYLRSGRTSNEKPLRGSLASDRSPSRGPMDGENRVDETDWKEIEWMKGIENVDVGLVSSCRGSSFRRYDCFFFFLV